MVDTNELSRLWEEARKETKKNQQIISDYIQAMTDKKLVVRSTYYCYSKTKDISVDVEFFDEAKGKADFGSAFGISYRVSSDGTRHKFRMGCGSMGSYTREEAPYQIDRMRLMLNIWDHEEEVIALFNSLPYEANRAAEKLAMQKEKEDEEADRIARDEKEQEVKAKIKVGYTFSDKNSKQSFEYTITKITPKRVYLEYTTSYKHTKYVWEDGVRTGEQTILRHIKSSGYIEYDLFVNLLTDLSIDGASRPVENYMKGAYYISTTDENLEFIPCE